MKDLILVTFYWIHLVATILWIGGISFILFIAIPSSKQALGTEAGKLMSEIAKRFTPLANLSIALLIISGIFLQVLSRKFSWEISYLENSVTMTLIIKHILVFGMIAIHFYRGLLLVPKIKRTVLDVKKATLQKLSINLVKVNFVLGLIVLLLSGILHIT